MNNRHPLTRQQQIARNQKMTEQLNKRASLEAQGLRPNANSPYDMEKNLEQIGMKAGNVGAINRIVWPFWFTFTAPQLGPNVTSQGFTTVTQEAAFVWMAYSKA